MATIKNSGTTETGRFPSPTPPGYFASVDREAMQAFYRENGYLVLENAFSREQVERLRAETVAICRGSLGEYRGLVKSAESESDDDVLRKYLCVHFPHKISPIMREALRHPETVDVLTAVIGPNVKCMQSMLFIKAAGKPGQAWHQDEHHIPTRDRSLTGVWIALDRATTENGCLWVIPGSHRPGVLWQHRWHADPRFDCTLESVGFPYTENDEVPVEVEVGSVVIFNGYLLHRSLPNQAESGFRRSLVNHYMSCESFLPWGRPPEKVSVARFDHRDVEVVAGEDPHAWKGYEDITRPHVRPSGEGGCDSFGGQERKYRTEEVDSTT